MLLHHYTSTILKDNRMFLVSKTGSFGNIAFTDWQIEMTEIKGVMRKMLNHILRSSNAAAMGW